MKNTITSILAGLVTFLLFYLLGAFVELSFDISKWAEGARVIVGAIGGTLSICVMIVAGCYKIMGL